VYNPEHPLKRLSEYEMTAPARAPMSSAVLFLAAAAFVISMPLAWHHHIIPGAGYTIVHGYQGASWLNVMAAIALVFGVRCLRVPPGLYTKWLLTILAFLTFIGMSADYIDTQARAAQVFSNAFYGAGFYVGLAGAGLVITACILTWRTPS
jgi:hypothetical protein